MCVFVCMCVCVHATDTHVALQMLTVLQKVNLVGNAIENVGQEALGFALKECRALTTADTIHSREIHAGLHLQIHAIYQVSFIANCLRRENVSAVDLSDNFLGRSNETLVDLMLGLGELKNLTDLNLSGNKPFSRDVCQTLSRSLKHMTSMRSLKLSNNTIDGDGADAIICTLVRLFQLEVLDLSNNSFKIFPVALSISCPILWKMELSDNPWKYPHAAVMKKNSTFIRDHLNLEFLNGTIDREMALMFVGKSEVGKTSLLKALLSEDMTADHVGLEDRTCGIELHSWKPLHSKTSPLFNIYDFAGLEMYECMHLNLCLLRRAIYCLVWRPFARLEPDACLDKNGVPAQEPWYRVPALGKCTRKQLVPYLQDQVTPWIDKLYRRVPGFTYLLIATHLDIIDEEDVAWQTQTIRQCVSTHMKHLGQRFSHVAVPTMLSCSTNLCVSATTGQNITLLQETLVNETVKLPFFGEILPKSWTKARQSIAQIRSIHRATLRTRKKEAHQEKVHTLFTQIRDPAGADSGLSPNSTNLNSEPPSDDEVSNVSSSDIMPLWKLWQIFAMRSLLRMRLKRAISTTPEMATGSMWIGHFKTLLKKAGIAEDQMFQVMRYFHDAGWIRCYGFNDTKLSKVRSNEHDGGFEMLDPYRCSCFKVATNSYVAMYRRDSGDRPPDVRPEAWTDMCDTVFLDLQWLFRMTLSVVTHDGTPIIAGQTSMQLRTEAQRLYSFGELQWAPGSPNLIGSLWKYFLPDHEFRRIRNVLESKSILTPSSENRSLLYVPELRKLVPLEDAQTRSSSHHQDWAPDNLQAPKPKHIPDEAAPQLTTNHAHHMPTHYEHATPDTMEDTTTDTTFLTTTSVHRGTSSEAPAHELPSLPQPTTLLSVRKNTQHAPLLNRKHLLGRTADNMQPGRCSVFLSYEQVEAGGKEHVYSSYIWPVLKHNVETIAHASVLKSSDYKTDLEYVIHIYIYIYIYIYVYVYIYICSCLYMYMCVY